ncbi:hypothetical protein C2E21_7208 [Chlorella sorokiniana]|uniref:Transcription termination factor mitochondrial n=1 Tax=Chlorella sorokiniana TaxID=3076 RepID=A0A2P6TI07_CHLSO|nr:hypothetical protein C2E21_7208 [Chlorella sorokiniana]|eukprot:PRW33932.1 hypothetical protein C2E21_7208 [Chlorella sorokiniana]
MATSGSVWRGFSTSPAAAAVAAAAAAAAAAAKPNKQAAAHELPLWCFLRQCGFSAAAISWMQHRVKGTRTSQQKVEQDLVPNIAALRAVGLDTATIERLYVSRPLLLHTSNATCIGALEVPRPLAALLPGDPCAVQAPPRATQLGVALWLYPAPAAELLRRRNLARLISGNLPLRQRLGISGSATAQAIFSNSAVLASDMQQAEALAAHLQRLQASGQLSAEQVARLALEPSGLSLSPAEFDRRRREGGAQALACIGLKDPKGRQQAAAAALGELLQAAAGVPGPLQQQHQQQGAALVKRCAAFMRATPTSLRANWAALHRTGLADGDIAAIVQQQPAVLTGNWEGDAKQLMAAWLQQELGLSLAQFLRRHVSHANKGVGRLAMRAAYLQQHRPAVWQRCYVRGAGPLLTLLCSTDTQFFSASGCTDYELSAFQRTWLQTPDGRRWGGKHKRGARRGS